MRAVRARAFQWRATIWADDVILAHRFVAVPADSAVLAEECPAQGLFISFAQGSCRAQDQVNPVAGDEQRKRKQNGCALDEPVGGATTNVAIRPLRQCEPYNSEIRDDDLRGNHHSINYVVGENVAELHFPWSPVWFLCFYYLLRSLLEN
jgi:hypothetical protein